MRMLAFLLAIICVIAAVMYYMMPAGQLPTFMPGYSAGSAHIHTTHALAAVEHLLPAGHQSLGIHLDVRHFAATPIGMGVTATAELTAVEGRTLSFKVEAHDEKEPIGGGTHQRVVVNVARFDERVQRKLT